MNNKVTNALLLIIAILLTAVLCGGYTLYEKVITVETKVEEGIKLITKTKDEIKVMVSESEISKKFLLEVDSIQSATAKKIKNYFKNEN